ncbi:MAG: NACHT domain-containing protein, partial [Candidatus Nealsonbacteria bacterium]|nr:NACHT domain-containing protein [Candidatus Nealsonbacteria bacterium]
MLDPLTTPLLLLVLGKLGHDVIGGACQDYLKDKLKGLFSKASKLGAKDDLQLAYEDAMQQAYETSCEVLLRNIETFGVKRSELPHYRESLEAFIRDRDVAAELYRSIEDPNDETAPSPQVLQDRWQAVDGHELPSDQLWLVTTLAYRNQALQQSFLSDPLREILLGKDVDRLLKEVLRQGGVKTQVRRDKYSLRMRTKFSPVDLANLMPAYADDPGRMVIRDVFVAQNVRENPPPVEIPKDLLKSSPHAPREAARHAERDDYTEDDERLEKLRTTYVSQSPKPVLDVIAATGNRLLVLTGEPGSGKSTLMRYLLTGIIEPPVDPQAGLPLPWTLAFEDAFPLLIELRDFYAMRRTGECDSFLEYVDYMGKTDQWFLDQHAVNGYLDAGPSLVMFDGLDEIFDPADRRRVMQEIAGFAQRYPRATIIVTSRPVGYKEQVLRDAGFAHFGIQDLADEQIETFIRGWFALTFPQQPLQAEQRIDRVLGSARQSKPIRLLAGNPMLLTIMALLGREEELPRQRAKFYEKAVEVLCHHWDANRNLQLPEDRYLNADEKKALLRRIAMRMQAGDGGLKGNIIAEDDLEQEIQGFLIDEQWETDAAEAKKAARRVIHQLRERNYILCLRGPHLYGFVHRTFLSYLTAAEYVRLFDKQPQQITIDELVELFDNHCRDDDWREVLRLICGQIDEQYVGRIVEHLATRTDLEKWHTKGSLPEIALAIHCLGDTRTPSRIEKSGRVLLEQTIELICRMFGAEGMYYDWAREELLNAAKELGSRWPGKEYLVDNARRFKSIRTGGVNVCVDFIVAIAPDRDVLGDLAFAESYSIRTSAIASIAELWPDETTRKLLVDHAVQDEAEEPREGALRALAKKWPDETTRKLLTERAVDDENEYTRAAALRSLVKKWPDET